MKKQNVFAFILLLCAFAAQRVTAQSGVYVPKKGKVFFKGDTATIFSNVVNEGKLGIGKNAVVNFSGSNWTNAPDAEISMDTVNGAPQGGWLRFVGDGRQTLDAGYNAAINSGVVFPNLEIQNPAGLQLQGSSAKVYRQLKFGQGLIYLNDQVFVLGHRNPGILTGYDSSRFFVGGTKPGGGVLVRENLLPADGLVVFPIGTAPGAYTPAALRSLSTKGDDYAVTVFDSVRKALFTGQNLADESVNKVWQIGKRYAPGEGDVDVVLQHLLANEGSVFAAARNRSYVSQYGANGWDAYYPQTLPGAGTLTSGAPLLNSGANSRVFFASLQQTSYFTKLTAGKIPGLQTKLIFTGYRYNASLVKLNWQTNPEINVKKFVVERRFANEANFYSIDTVASQALNGYSTYFLNYALDDKNNYRGISFYRLKIFDYNDSSYYSNIIGVSGSVVHKVTVWPNPTPDKFTVILYGHIAESVVLHNSLGQLVYQEPVNNRSVIEMRGYRYAAGVYYVSVVGKDGRIIQSEKLLIVR